MKVGVLAKRGFIYGGCGTRFMENMQLRMLWMSLADFSIGPRFVWALCYAKFSPPVTSGYK
jgi:hypothetical protein